MNKLQQLEKICAETTGCMFRLGLWGDKQWGLYIYRSKLLFKGSFDEVVEMGIQEFLKYRSAPDDSDPKNMRQKYRYRFSKKERAAVAGTKVIRNKVYKDAYTLKLEFSQSLGYKNFTECHSELGRDEFEIQFKNYKDNN